jgi:3-dehydroquinate dehydratase-2
MDTRGKTQVEIFGPVTLPEYDRFIRASAVELGMDVEIVQSNVEGDIIDWFYAARDRGVDAAIINPAGFMTGHPALMAAIASVPFPTIEVHVSNPSQRGLVSEVVRVCRGSVTGFGLIGYDLALRGIRATLPVESEP